MTMINDTQLIKRIIALQPIASKDETRYHLNSIILEKMNGQEFRLYATDGHKLVIESYTTSGEWFNTLLDGEKLFFRHEHIPILKQVIKTWGKHDMVFISTIRVGRGVNFQFCDSTTLTVCNESSEGKYPNIDQLIPKKTKSMKEICFNAELMMQIAKACANPKSKGVRILFKDKLSPIIVEPQVMESVNVQSSVLMPMRGTWD